MPWRSGFLAAHGAGGAEGALSTDRATLGAANAVHLGAGLATAHLPLYTGFNGNIGGGAGSLGLPVHMLPASDGSSALCHRFAQA